MGGGSARLTTMLHIDDFDYVLPDASIAQTPVENLEGPCRRARVFHKAGIALKAADLTGHADDPH